jgi:hypothetical protein
VASRYWGTESLAEVHVGDRLEMPVDITVIERFLNKK